MSLSSAIDMHSGPESYCYLAPHFLCIPWTVHILKIRIPHFTLAKSINTMADLDFNDDVQVSYFDASQIFHPCYFSYLYW